MLVYDKYTLLDYAACMNHHHSGQAAALLLYLGTKIKRELLNLGPSSPCLRKADFGTSL